MAVKTIRLADYFRIHLRKVIYLSAVFIFTEIVILAILIINNLLPSVNPMLLVGLLIGLQVCTLFILLRFALTPLNILTRAITHISNQANDTEPPDINQHTVVKTGLRDMVQTVYNAAEKARSHEVDLTPRSDIADHLPCGIIAMDANGAIIYHNAAAPVISDSKNDKHINLEFPRYDSIKEWLAANTKHKMSDHKMWERVQTAPPGTPDRKICDVIGFFRNGATNGLETIIVTIDRTETYSDDDEALDFISIAAHELRGPITIIRGYLSVLIDELQPVLQDDQFDLMSRLDVSASRLSSYVNNILNVAKYDRHHLKLHLSSERLSDIYESIAPDLKLRAQTQGKLLSVNIPTDLPMIAADRDSLAEVITNLIDNALKYSHEGGHVQVAAAIDGSFIKCSVKDQGIGIPASVMSNLFGKFYRSHRSRANVSGTGLGLYISKAIIESHGGKIGVQSREGEGAIFTFSVPIYSTVADKLAASHNINEGIIESSSGWIKNHSKIGSG